MSSLDGSTNASADVLVQVTDLTVAFGSLRAVDGLSFTLEKGAALGLVGESGSGKSTVASALLGLHRGTGADVGGSVRVAGSTYRRPPTRTCGCCAAARPRWSSRTRCRPWTRTTRSATR